MIKITLTNGSVVTWEEEEYTEYKCDGIRFIVADGDKWIAAYRLSSIVSINIEVKEIKS